MSVVLRERDRGRVGMGLRLGGSLLRITYRTVFHSRLPSKRSPSPKIDSQMLASKMDRLPYHLHRGSIGPPFKLNILKWGYIFSVS